MNLRATIISVQLLILTIFSFYLKLFDFMVDKVNLWHGFVYFSVFISVIKASQIRFTTFMILFKRAKVINFQELASKIKKFFTLNDVIRRLVVRPVGAVGQIRAAFAFKLRGNRCIDDCPWTFFGGLEVWTVELQRLKISEVETSLPWRRVFWPTEHNQCSSARRDPCSQLPGVANAIEFSAHARQRFFLAI